MSSARTRSSSSDREPGRHRPGSAASLGRLPTLPLLILLGIVTGLALMAMANVVTEPNPLPERQSGDAAANVALVRSFYAAANAVLGTGDAAPLDALLAPGFVEHPATVGGGAGRANLVHELQALGSVFPGLRLVVDSAEATGTDEITTRIHVEGATAGVFLGLPLPATMAVWGPVEVWRIADGWVAERWAGESAPVRPELLWQASIGRRAANVEAGLTLNQITLPAGNREVLAGGVTTRVIAVEAGAVTLLPGHPHPVTTGSVVAASADVPVEVRNDAAATAVVLDLETGSGPVWDAIVPSVSAPFARLATPPTPRNPRTDVRVLVSLPATAMPAGAIVALGRLELAPGIALPFAATRQPVVLGVEAGLFSLEAAGGGTWTIGQNGLRWTLGAATLGDGDAAVLDAGTTTTWRAAGDAPVAVLVVALAPADGGVGTMAGGSRPP
jgi:hypothetical protein